MNPFLWILIYSDLKFVTMLSSPSMVEETLSHPEIDTQIRLRAFQDRQLDLQSIGQGPQQNMSLRKKILHYNHCHKIMMIARNHSRSAEYNGRSNSSSEATEHSLQQIAVIFVAYELLETISLIIQYYKTGNLCHRDRNRFACLLSKICDLTSSIVSLEAKFLLSKFLFSDRVKCQIRKQWAHLYVAVSYYKDRLQCNSQVSPAD
jgi:hypothetical protein